MRQKPAGFWVRFFATFIDSIIVAVISIILSIIFQDAPNSLEDSTSAFIFQLMYSVIGVIYLTASRFKGTPGKIILGIQVVKEDGERIGIGRSIGRFFAYFLSALIFYIGYLMVAFREDKKSLHDLICHTRVVYRDIRE
ncbi:RDD family protein [Alkalihalobacillus sp. FSL W8-0930]